MLFLRFFIFIVALASAASTAVKAQSERYLALVDSAQTDIGLEAWSLAEQHLLAAMRLEPALPSNVLLMSNLGIVQFHQGHTDRAIATLSDAIAMAPNAVVLINNRARVYTALGRDNEAMADYARVLQIDSLSTVALFNHGMLSLAKNDLATAERDITRLASIVPVSRDTAMALAALRTRQGNYDEAIKQYDRLIELQPSDELYLARAMCLIMAERLSDALTDLNEAIKLNPINGELYARRALVNKLTYRTAEYESDRKRAEQLGVTVEPDK